jgi:hypothetical protein
MNNQNPFKWRHFEIRHHSAVRALVAALFAQLPRSGGNDTGAVSARRSHHELRRWQPWLIGRENNLATIVYYA